MPSKFARCLCGSLVCCLLAFASAPGAEVRTWTDSTGKFSTEAELVAIEDGFVVLRQDGTDKTKRIPIDRLSQRDQDFVYEEIARQEAEKTRREKEAAEAEESQSYPGGRPPNNVVNSVRGAVYRDETLKKLRQIALAIKNYEATRQRFPSSAIYTGARKPGLSWRVALLPMLEEQGLYNQFRRNEPWDSPHNMQMVERMPRIFESPGSDLEPGFTNYLAVVGPNTVIAAARRGARPQDIRDGLSKTVMLVEADDTYASIWTKPDDYLWDRSQPMYGLGNIWTGQFFVAFADGSARRLPVSIGNEQLNALFSRNGGEVISPF